MTKWNQAQKRAERLAKPHGYYIAKKFSAHYKRKIGDYYLLIEIFNPARFGFAIYFYSEKIFKKVLKFDN